MNNGKLGRKIKGSVPLQTSPVKTILVKWDTYCDICFGDIKTGTYMFYNINTKEKRHRNCK